MFSKCFDVQSKGGISKDDRIPNQLWGHTEHGLKVKNSDITKELDVKQCVFFTMVFLFSLLYGCNYLIDMTRKCSLRSLKFQIYFNFTVKKPQTCDRRQIRI